jgi:TIR domain
MTYSEFQEMPRMKKTSSVFISHSSKDKKFVSRLATAFKKHGIDYWLDAHEIRPGRDFFNAIEDGLKGRSFYDRTFGKLVESEWVDRE